MDRRSNMTDWTTPIIGFIGVIIGIASVEIRLWRERKERYQIMTFERRLEVHQQAFGWCLRISDSLGKSYGDLGANVNAMLAVDLDKLYNEANEWYFNHCLYLDDDSRRDMFTAIGLPLERAEQLTNNVKATNEFIQQARNTLRETMRYVTKGIGSEYLPEIERRSKKDTTSAK
jgi:hypothetical protein